MTSHLEMSFLLLFCCSSEGIAARSLYLVSLDNEFLLLLQLFPDHLLEHKGTSTIDTDFQPSHAKLTT